MSVAGSTRRSNRGGRVDDSKLDLVPILMGVLAILGAIVAGIAAADTLLLAVAGAAALLLGTAIVLRPDVATLTTVAILYSNAAVVAVRFHGVPLFVAALVPMLLVVPLARDLIVRRQPVVAPPMLPWMVVLLFIHLISALFSIDTGRSWDEVVVFAVEGFGAVLPAHQCHPDPGDAPPGDLGPHRGRGTRQRAVRPPGGHIELQQRLLRIRPGLDRGLPHGCVDADRRRAPAPAGGSIGETNRFAQVMLMLVPLGVFRFIAEPNRAVRFVAAGATGFITLGVVLTFSRGAAVGLGVLMVALVVLRLIQARHAFTVTVLLTFVIAIFPQYLTRVASLGSVAGSSSQVDTSLLSRVTETLAAALVIVDHPILGVGPGMFPNYYERYAEVVGILVKNDVEREAHNLYLGVGAELGVVGLAAFIWIALLTARMILIARRRSLVQRPDLERLTTPFLLALMSYHVTGLFLHLSFARFYWIILGVAGAAAVITLRETEPEPEPGTAKAGPRSGRGPAGRTQLPYSQSV